LSMSSPMHHTGMLVYYLCWMEFLLPLYLYSAECGQNNFLTSYVHIYHSYYPSIRITILRNYEVNNTVWAESCLVWCVFVCVTFASVHPLCRMLLHLAPSDHILYKSQQIHLQIFFLHMLTNLFLSPQNAVYFLVLSFLVHKIFIFYVMV
jgi:hypothetical protein